MYVLPNFKTKKALKEAVKREEHVSVYQPNDMFGTPIPKDGKVSVEGPHYPKPHSWYAQCTLADGKVVRVS